MTNRKRLQFRWMSSSLGGNLIGSAKVDPVPPGAGLFKIDKASGFSKVERARSRDGLTHSAPCVSNKPLLTGRERGGCSQTQSRSTVARTTQIALFASHIACRRAPRILVQHEQLYLALQVLAKLFRYLVFE